jgi:hypothetical protein
MPPPKMKSVPESKVVKLWLGRLKQTRRLTDSEGEPLEVVYPGRPNDGRGGDFRDAVIFSGPETRQGCIEVHTRSSGWQTHGHHLDPLYNEVVLHVALEQDRRGKTVLQNGKTVPTIILGRPLHRSAPVGRHGSGLPCGSLARKQRLKTLGGILDRAGDRRFQDKAARFQPGAAPAEAGQSLYQGMAEALGYTKNKIPFRELSRRVPLTRLSGLLDMGRPAEACLLDLQSLLLGCAGLLPSQRGLQALDIEYVLRLERRWASGVQPDAMSVSDWELFKVRPGNYPVGRIISLSHWLCRYRPQGFFPALVDLVRQVPAERLYIDLESALLVAAEGYWAGHYDFGLPGLRGTSRTLLGRERASAVIINVILPFTFFWSRQAAEPELGRKVREIYAAYPRRGVNSIERHMRHQLAIGPDLVNSARRQQGLVHLYKAYCTQGKCAECELA